MTLGQYRAYSPYKLKMCRCSPVFLIPNRMTDRQTLKDRATQLLRSRSEALVTQYTFDNQCVRHFLLWWVLLHRVAFNMSGPWCWAAWASLPYMAGADSHRGGGWSAHWRDSRLLEPIRSALGRGGQLGVHHSAKVVCAFNIQKFWQNSHYLEDCPVKN